MDPAAILGILITLGAVFTSMIIEGTSPMAIILIPPLILVFLGTIGVTMAGGILPDAIALPKYIIEALTAKKVQVDAVVETIVKMAEKARRDGMLALDGDIRNLDEPFLQRGLEMAVDGTDTGQIQEILGAEIASTAADDARKAKVFQDMAGYAPTIGIIGTVIGLIHVLGNLADPTELGAQIASAFVATLWGVMSANAFWMPISNRLKRVSAAKIERMEVCLEGVLAIQSGANPRLVARKLNSLLPPAAAQRQKEAA